MSEPIKTIPGGWFSFICTSPGTITAKIDGQAVTIATLAEAGSVIFCAPSDTVQVETTGKFRVLPTKAVLVNTRSATSGGTSEPDTYSISCSTRNGTGNTWWNYAVINPRYFEAGLLHSVSVRARSASSGAHEIWMGVFEQQEGGSDDPSTWKFIGTSEQSCIQKNGTDTTWTFRNVALSGRPIALIGMATPDIGWNMATQIGAFASTRDEDDAISLLVASTTLKYIPQMVMRIGIPVSHAIVQHEQNSTAHLTAAEHDGLTALLSNKDALLALLAPQPAEE